VKTSPTLGHRVTGPTTFSLLALAYVAGAVSMWGVYFDTSWHRTIGRDSFFSLPHLFMFGGGAAVGVVVAAAIALATQGRLRDLGGPIGRLGPIRLPFGFALAAAGVLIAVLGIPVDAWFHATFGKDVLIWSWPHMQGVIGGSTGALGLLFAAAAQRGRGALAPPWRWQLAMLPPLVDLLHRLHYALAHYTMTPPSRTPDFYPFLVALAVPAIFVAALRAAGVWAPTLAGLLFFVVTALVDTALRALDFERYTVTPLLVVPALAVSALALAAPRRRDSLSFAVGAGLLATLVFVGMETAWMAWVVGQPWPTDRLLAGLPRALVAGGLSGGVGWIVGGFLRAAGEPLGVAAVFGNRRRARWATGVAMALVVVGLAATYQPQRFGPPMRVEEFGLVAVDRFKVQEAVFWEALLQDEWPTEPRLELRSEGIIDGIPLPIGPTWCAASVQALEAELPHLRLELEINGAPVDFSRYPMVRQRLRDGRLCEWAGVVSTFQRASVNRFVYTVTPMDGAPAGLRPTRIDFEVVFKDP